MAWLSPLTLSEKLGLLLAILLPLLYLANIEADSISGLFGILWSDEGPYTIAARNLVNFGSEHIIPNEIWRPELVEPLLHQFAKLTITYDEPLLWLRTGIGLQVLFGVFVMAWVAGKYHHSRNAAIAWPDPSAQSRMSTTSVAGNYARTAATIACHQPQPAYSAAPGADSNVTGRPGARAVRASASPCTITAGGTIMLDVQAVDPLHFKRHHGRVCKGRSWRTIPTTPTRRRNAWTRRWSALRAWSHACGRARPPHRMKRPCHQTKSPRAWIS